MSGPNTRVQRTRSSPSAPHSPLTRYPVRRQKVMPCPSTRGFEPRGEIGCSSSVRSYSYLEAGPILLLASWTCSVRRSHANTLTLSCSVACFGSRSSQCRSDDRRDGSLA